jgi:hypothetical protein
MAALAGLSALFPALAGPPKPADSFAHKYTPVYGETVGKPNLALMVHAPSFQTLIEAQPDQAAGSAPSGVIGGIHQGAKATVVGAAAGQPVRFELTAGTRVILRVGDQSIDTGLLAAQARPMASLVANGNNALITLSDRVAHYGKRGYSPRVAASYIDTEEGFWLLWADAIAENLFYQVPFRQSEFPDGLTIVDSKFPVTIRIDGGLEVRGGDPWVAFWKRNGGKPGAIVRYEDLGRVMEPRGEDDVQAMEAVRRVFKWAPVMRLAAESDPAAFETFVRRLDQIRITTVTTPRLLIDE